MKNILLFIAISFLGSGLLAQNHKAFFNEECVSVKNKISSIRENPTDDDFHKYHVDSTNGMPIETDQNACKLAARELDLKLSMGSKYTPPSARLIIISHGYTEEEAIESLLSNPKSADIILNTYNNVGLYVKKEKSKISDRELYHIYFIIPFKNSNTYSRIK